MTALPIEPPSSPSPADKFNNTPLAWEPLPFMDEILLEKQIELKSQDYIRVLKAGLSHFTVFCKTVNIEHPGQVQRMHLLQYQAWVNRQPWAKSYKSQQMKYVRIWFRWLTKNRYLPENPWYNLQIPEVSKIPNPLEDDELAMLFARHRQEAFVMPPFFYHRREVILTLLYVWGLRIHELHSLNVAQMDMRLDHVLCINKGGRNKTLPYSPATKEIVMRWGRARTKYARVGEDALIIDQEGRRLSISRTRQIIVDLGVKCGLDIHPHQLRDTCGTHLLDEDVEVERVMKILGHTKRDQTLAYARVNDHKVAEAHQRAMDHRLERLLPNNVPPPSEFF